MQCRERWFGVTECVIAKYVLQRKEFHLRQSSDARLYSKKKEIGTGLTSYKQVTDETKTKVLCYKAAVAKEWIR